MARYALVGDGQTNYLLPGKNVIGRGTVELQGVSFVEISSPNSSVSRVQANIEICPNGDAWICDCNSTNGTFLSINDGPGVCLEQKHYYQLKDGCHVIFGDVERVFKCVSSASAEATEPPPRVSSDASVRRATTTVQMKRSRSEEEAGRRSSSIKKDSLTPYLSEKPPSASVSPKKTTAAAKDQEEAPPPLKKMRNGIAATSIAACLSGMDAEEREEAKKAIRRHGRVVEDISKANVLVVRLPAVRTPKFIIAVGRCIPIVGVESFSGSDVKLEKFQKEIVSLRHEKNVYSSDALRASIYRLDKDPILAGRTFSLHSLPSKVRDVAKDVITGCGGAVIRVKPKNSEAKELTEEGLNQLYDAILRGKRCS